MLLLSKRHISYDDIFIKTKYFKSMPNSFNGISRDQYHGQRACSAHWLRHDTSNHLPCFIDPQKKT